MDVAPWQCLFPESMAPNLLPPPSSSSLPPPQTIHKMFVLNLPQQKSFVQALKNSCDVPQSQLPKPCIKGDAVSIKISEDEYKKGLEECRMNLHGRLILSKGEKPIKFDNLRVMLGKLWKPIGQWRMTSLGKGFFEFGFSSQEDLRSVWTVGSWSLNPGLLRLSKWCPDFNPKNQKQTHTQCWIRIYDLPQEYWRSRILFEVAAGISTPIAIDEMTRKRYFGHYARVLVDLDLSGELVNEILVERDSFAFYVGIEYERLPEYCKHCQTIGHSVVQCNKKAVVSDKVTNTKLTYVQKGKAIFVPKE